MGNRDLVPRESTLERKMIQSNEGKETKEDEEEKDESDEITKFTRRITIFRVVNPVHITFSVC
jgi:hypothetical protein